MTRCQKGHRRALSQRVLGKNNELTLRLRKVYARALYEDDGATLGDLHEAVETLEDTARTARRVLGSTHPVTTAIGESLYESRATLAVAERVKH